MLYKKVTENCKTLEDLEKYDWSDAKQGLVKELVENIKIVLQQPLKRQANSIEPATADILNPRSIGQQAFEE